MMSRVPHYNLEAFRKNRKMTIAELSAKSGVSIQNIKYFEKRGNKIRKEDLIALSSTFNCTTDEIIYGEKYPVFETKYLTLKQIKLIIELYKECKVEDE